MAEPGPSRILLLSRAAEAMDRIARDVADRDGTEWGGVLFGDLLDDERHTVVVTDATMGICTDTSAVFCDIQPESWPVGERAIRDDGREPGTRLGTWHSHPHMRAWPSSTDEGSWFGYSLGIVFVGIIVNPYRGPAPERTTWTYRAGELVEAESLVISDELYEADPRADSGRGSSGGDSRAWRADGRGSVLSRSGARRALAWAMSKTVSAPRCR